MCQVRVFDDFPELRKSKPMQKFSKEYKKKIASEYSVMCTSGKESEESYEKICGFSHP